MIYPIANILNLKLLFFVLSFWLIFVNQSEANILDNWKLSYREHETIAFESKATSSRFMLSYASNVGDIYTAKDYAKKLLDKNNGLNLIPIPKLKGWEFSFVADLPCAVIVNKQNNKFEVAMLCGNASIEDVSELISISRAQLKI
jgi:hypothetical protein